MMKSVFILLLAVGLSLQTPVEVEDGAKTELPEEPEMYPDGECPEVDGDFPVYLSDMKNCSIFYQCANGTPYKMSCSFPLEFNPTLKVCDFPGLSGCIYDKRAPFRMIGRCPPNLSPGVTKLLRDSEDNTIYYECVEGNPVLRQCPEGTIFTFRRTCEPVVAPFKMIGRCPPYLSPGVTKLLRDSEDNTIYYECVEGKAVLRQCPEGTIFTFRRTCEPAAE